jgi:hypothetical protein
VSLSKECWLAAGQHWSYMLEGLFYQLFSTKQSNFIMAHKNFILLVVSTVMVAGFMLASHQLQTYMRSGKQHIHRKSGFNTSKTWMIMLTRIGLQKFDRNLS